MQALAAGQLAESPCCASALYTLAFAPDGRTLTGTMSRSQPPQLRVRDYVFVWNVTSPQSVNRIAVFSRNIATSDGNSSLPLIAPRGHTVAAGAPFGQLRGETVDAA